MPLNDQANRTEKTLLESIAALFPQSWVGVAEYHIKPSVLDGFGVLNGQCFRQLIFIDLCRACHFEAIVETGTYVGCTARFFAGNAAVPVHTVESSPRYFQLAKRHLKPFPNVYPVLGGSLEFLRSLAVAPETRVFFYLDAHWRDHLPLAEEVELIISRFPKSVIMIDDFAVPGDEGYTFDDYGPGKQLSLRDFPFHKDPRFSVYFPLRPSSQESGNRRGCVVLASHEMKAAVDSLDCLSHRVSTEPEIA